MLHLMNGWTRQVYFLARGALLLVLLSLAIIGAPSAQAQGLAAQDNVGHVVRLDGPAVVRIVSVIQAKLICHGCLSSGGDISSPKSDSLTYASSGSGAFITPDGYVLTADHVVDHGPGNPEDVDLVEQAAASDIAKQLNNGTDTPASVLTFLQNHPSQVEIQTNVPFEKVFLSTNYTGSLQSAGDIISYDVTSVAAHSPVTQQDTAIIKVNAQDVPYLAVAPPNSVTVGDTVTAIAYPADADLALNNADFTALVDPTQSDINTLNSLLGPSVNTGQVTAKKTRSDGTGVYESNGISSQGSSGGPVIDNQGQIIGFVDAGPSTDRLTFLIPSDVIATYTSQAGANHPSAGTFMTLWTKAANEYDSSASCHWSNAAKDLSTLHTQYPKFGGIQQYLTKAQQQAAGETCAATTTGNASSAPVLVIGGILLLLIIGAVVLLVVLLSRRKQPTLVPVAIPAGAAYPMQSMNRQAEQGAHPGAYPGYPPTGYGQQAAPSMPYQPPQQSYPSQGPAYPTQQQAPGYPGYPPYNTPAMPAPLQGQPYTPMQPFPPAQPAQPQQPAQQTPPQAQPYPQQFSAPAPQALQPPQAPQPQAVSEAGAAAAPTTPMRRCLNGHIVTDPAAIFCPDCGAGIQSPQA